MPRSSKLRFRAFPAPAGRKCRIKNQTMILKPTTMLRSTVLIARLNSQLLRSRLTITAPRYRTRTFSAPSNDNLGSHVKVDISHSSGNKIGGAAEIKEPNDEKVVVSACGDVDSDDDDDEEQEEMFVEAHESFGHNMVEWGGPRRGGRLPEPTRFGDWERKGRCTDF